ncbi:MAG TPA: hypothetical protein PKD85_19135, partial [Saprospiraceae bacterium]|nr:hypothetical protein [Saprospiraceae bacterium]
KISNQIKIVVPGTIDYSARNYKDLSVFLCSEFFNDVEIVFLGKIKNLSMISNLVQKGSKVEFVYQKNGFTSEEYEYHLSQADLAILPLKRHVFQSTTYEIQGKTLMSGSINDVSRFSIPFFYYEKISIPEAFKKVSISYKNGKHLNDLLQDAILNKSYLDLRNNYESLFDEQNYITKGQKLLNKLLSN